MEDEELKNLWEDTPGNIDINPQQILLEMNFEIQEMDESIKKRNLMEIMACILIIIFFSAKFFFFTILMQKVGAALAVLGAIFIIYKLLTVQNSQKRADLSNDAKSQMIADRKYLQKEQKLLKNVLYWYLLPIFIPMFFIVISNGLTWFNTILYGTFILGSGYFTYRINQKAAKKFDPILANLDAAIREMEE